MFEGLGVREELTWRVGGRQELRLATMAMGHTFKQCQHSPNGEDACEWKEHDPYFRLTCYKSFIPLGVKDSSLRLYICHHERGTKGRETAAYHG